VTGGRLRERRAAPEQNEELVDPTERLTIIHGSDGTVFLEGELDAYTAPTLESELSDGPTEGDLRLDLSQVSFMDSTGIRAVIKADNELRARDHALVIVSPSPAVLRLLQLTSLDEHLRIEDGA